MMKNKKSILIATLVLAMSLLVVTAFAGTPNNNGYEALKQLIKSNQQDEITSGMVIGSLEITDNDETVLSVSGNLAGDAEEKFMGGEFRILTNHLDKELSVYGKNNLFYISDLNTDDVYVAKDDCDGFEEEKSHGFDEDMSLSRNEEALIDYFVGDLANEFQVVNKSKGAYDIKLELNKSEIPTLLNLLTSVESEQEHGIKKASHQEKCTDFDFTDYPLLNEICSAKPQITELVHNVEIEYLNITINVSAKDEVEGLLFTLKMSGDDENAENHTLTYKGNMNFSNVGDVAISAMELEGKNIIELPAFEEGDM